MGKCQWKQRKTCTSQGSSWWSKSILKETLKNVPVSSVTEAAGASNKPSPLQNILQQQLILWSVHSIIYTVDCLSCYACPLHFVCGVIYELWCSAPISAVDLTPWLESQARWDHPSEGFDLRPTGSLPPLHAALSCTEPLHHLPPSGLVYPSTVTKHCLKRKINVYFFFGKLTLKRIKMDKVEVTSCLLGAKDFKALPLWHTVAFILSWDFGQIFAIKPIQWAEKA